MREMREMRALLIIGLQIDLAPGLAALGLRTSKIGAYAPPRAKAYSGPFAGLVTHA